MNLTLKYNSNSIGHTVHPFIDVKKLRQQADKSAFLLMNKFTNYQRIISEIFKNNSTKIYVIKLQYSLSSAILALVQKSLNYIRLYPEHNLINTLGETLKSQLSLSNNLEDPFYTVYYLKNVRLFSLLLSQFGSADTAYILKNLIMRKGEPETLGNTFGLGI